MTHVRRHARLLVALALAAVAAALILLAVDVRSWQSTVTRDDLRFRALPSHRDLWRPATLLPGDPAGRLLGGGGALAYRRAAQLFWLTRTELGPEALRNLAAVRAEAQERLSDLSTGASRPDERSGAENLLGVLVITSPVGGNDRDAVLALLRNAAEDFKQAIVLDPANTDAKQNLELVLRLQRPGKGQLGRDARSGYGMGKGQAASPVGGGY